MKSDDMDPTPDRPKKAIEPRDRKPPRVTLDRPDAQTLDIGQSGDWSRLSNASRNATVTEALIGQLALMGAEGRKMDTTATDFALGFVDAMEPRDPAEVLLLAQMAVTHQAVMMMARHANHTKTLQQKDCAEKALNKTARTFASQMETLKRYRSKGQQVVRVERVTVEAGAQAVVGNVGTGGGGRNEI